MRHHIQDLSIGKGAAAAHDEVNQLQPQIRFVSNPQSTKTDGIDTGRGIMGVLFGGKILSKFNYLISHVTCETMAKKLKSTRTSNKPAPVTRMVSGVPGLFIMGCLDIFVACKTL